MNLGEFMSIILEILGVIWWWSLSPVWHLQEDLFAALMSSDTVEFYPGWADINESAAFDKLLIRQLSAH